MLMLLHFLMSLLIISLLMKQQRNNFGMVEVGMGILIKRLDIRGQSWMLIKVPANYADHGRMGSNRADRQMFLSISNFDL